MSFKRVMPAVFLVCLFAISAVSAADNVTCDVFCVNETIDETQIGTTQIPINKFGIKVIINTATVLSKIPILLTQRILWSSLLLNSSLVILISLLLEFGQFVLMKNILLLIVMSVEEYV